MIRSFQCLQICNLYFLIYHNFPSFSLSFPHIRPHSLFLNYYIMSRPFTAPTNSVLPLQPRRPSLDIPTYFPTSSDSSRTLQATPVLRPGDELVDRTTQRLSAELQQLGFSEWSAAVKNIRQSYLLNRSGLSPDEEKGGIVGAKAAYVDREQLRKSDQIDAYDNTVSSERFRSYPKIVLPESPHFKSRDTFNSAITSSGPEYSSINSKDLRKNNNSQYYYVDMNSRPDSFSYAREYCGEAVVPSDLGSNRSTNTTSSYVSFGVSEKYDKLRNFSSPGVGGMRLYPSTISNFFAEEMMRRPRTVEFADDPKSSIREKKSKTRSGCCIIFFTLLLVLITITVAIVTVKVTSSTVNQQPINGNVTNLNPASNQTLFLSSSTAFILDQTPGACAIPTVEDDFVVSMVYFLNTISY